MFWKVIICLFVLAFENALSHHEPRLFTTTHTNWCGVVPTAESNNDLGIYSNLDACCRDHYKCESIGPHEELHEITNDKDDKLYHCDCDMDFYKCLKELMPDVYFEDAYKNTVGWKYFNAGHPQCYNKTMLATCAENHTYLLITRCAKYLFAEQGEESWQRFDNPFYRIIF